MPIGVSGQKLPDPMIEIPVRRFLGPGVQLDELGPMGLFERHYRATYDSEPAPSLIEDFAQLLEEVEIAREARLAGEPSKATKPSRQADKTASADKAKGGQA